MRHSNITSLFLSGLIATIISFPVGAAERTAHAHAGPGPKWAKTLEITSGSHVKVGSCKAGWGHHDWCKVSYKGKSGFIHEGALKPMGKHAIVSPVITTEQVNLHSSASSSSKVTTHLNSGIQVNVAHCSVGWLKGWCRVNHEGHSGFVKGSALWHD